ncbi:ABC transporter permease [Luteimonas pelagia]
MFGYYFQLALRSFRRNKVLTALMVLAIALGIGAAMTTMTVFHVLSGDPLPGRSQDVYYVQLDAEGMSGYQPDSEPAGQLTRFDAEALLRDGKAKRQAIMSGLGLSIEPQREGVGPFNADARQTTADFFPMFDVPFAFGNGWTATQDAERARVAVISGKLNERLFGGEDSTGRTVRLEQTDFRVVGVLDDWQPVPRFYDLNNGQYGEVEQVFIPFSTARDMRLGHNGNMSCWADSSDQGDEGQYGPNAPCLWVQYWVELEDAAAAGAYRQYLENYSEQQRAAGRFERPVNVRLRDVMEWLEFNRVVPSDVRLQAWLAMGFLLVCLVNTTGLLLAKFMRRSAEIGVRRALGASKRAVFAQYLVESAAIGLAGGVLGLGLALAGLWAVRQQPAGYAEYAHIDLAMLATTFVLAVGASMLAGMLPAWRACQVAPAIQLKSQ